MTLKRIDKDEMLTCSLVGKYPFKEVQDVIKETSIHQLEADQKEYDKLKDQVKGLEELMGGQKEAHNAVIKSLAYLP